MRLLVACHDAGGAEVVSAWLRRQGGEHEVRYALDGPARAIFERKLGVTRAASRPPAVAAVRGLDLVLCGTSGAAELERRTIRAARSAGAPSAAWLDHWTGYRERFTVDGRLVLPDEVWVSDEHAARIAAEQLPDARLRLLANPYLQDAAAEIRALAGTRPAGEGGERILYVTEPTAAAAERVTGDPRGFGYDEHEALEGYLTTLAAPAAVRIRPHPAEPAGKYDATLAAWAGRLPIEPSPPGATLAEDCAWADTVAGCETMALVVALHAGRRAVSAIPPGGRPLQLPFDAIHRLHSSAGPGIASGA